LAFFRALALATATQRLDADRAEAATILRFCSRRSL
jgi:hypothetical protein